MENRSSTKNRTIFQSFLQSESKIRLHTRKQGVFEGFRYRLVYSRRQCHCSSKPCNEPPAPAFDKGTLKWSYSSVKQPSANSRSSLPSSLRRSHPSVFRTTAACWTSGFSSTSNLDRMVSFTWANSAFLASLTGFGLFNGWQIYILVWIFPTHFFDLLKKAIHSWKNLKVLPFEAFKLVFSCFNTGNGFHRVDLFTLKCQRQRLCWTKDFHKETGQQWYSRLLPFSERSIALNEGSSLMFWRCWMYMPNLSTTNCNALILWVIQRVPETKAGWERLYDH